MKFKHTILYVENVGNSLTFYKEAFGLETHFIHDGGDYGELDTGSTVLSFASRELIKELGKNAVAPDAKSPVFELAFETEDVQTAYENRGLCIRRNCGRKTCTRTS